MKIHNIKIGFATNSSSKHNYLLTEKEVKDVLTGNFGWSWFMLASKEMKAQYVCAHLLRELMNTMSREAAVATIKGLTGIEVGKYELDHQSIICFPYKKIVDYDYIGSKYYIDFDYFKDMFDYFVNTPNLVIIGGNDNEDPLSDPGVDEDGNPYSETVVDEKIKEVLSTGKSVFERALKDVDTNGKYLIRKDPKYNYYTTFRKDNGEKVRFTFDDKDITKAYAPELVDLKITDYCTKGCKFCYQKSTPRGKHADFKYITQIAEVLSKLNVFEVAIGGGEPTSHPQFARILQTFDRNGIIPNFSTATYDWVLDKEKVEVVKNHVGGFAYSVSPIVENRRIIDTEVSKNIAEAVNIFEKFGLKEKMSLQIIPDMFSEWGFRDILRSASRFKLPLTLLGYKSIGRAEKFGRPFKTNWMELREDFVKNNRDAFCKIGIDTVLAKEYEEQLRDYPRWLYSIKEGDFNMYIDAVNKIAGPSSFCPKEQRASIDTANDPDIDIDFTPYMKETMEFNDAGEVTGFTVGIYDWEKKDITDKIKLENKLLKVFETF